MDNLFNALATYYQPESIYAWGEKLEELDCFCSLKVDALGEVEVPLSLEVNLSWQMNESKTCLTGFIYCRMSENYKTLMIVQV